MKQGTLPDIAPKRRKLVLNSWVCNNNIVVVVGTFYFILRCWVEACNGKEGDCNHLTINKVSIMGTDLDFMSCYSMKNDFDHFWGYEKYGLWMNLCNSKGGSTLWGHLTPGKKWYSTKWTSDKISTSFFSICGIPQEYEGMEYYWI